MRSLEKGTTLLADIAVEGLDVETRQLDVCDPDSIASALADAADIDVLVNNAGFEVQGALEMIDDELMHRQLDTNVLGPLRLIRSVMPAWRERGHGSSSTSAAWSDGRLRRSVVRMPHRNTHWRPCRKRCIGRPHRQESVST